MASPGPMVYLQIEAIQKDAIMLRCFLSNDARNVGVGHDWGNEFSELRMGAILVGALMDANVELSIVVGLLEAGSDAADSQRMLPLASFGSATPYALPTV